MSVLCEVESLFPTADWRIGSIPVWPLVRMRWFFREWTAHYTASLGAGASPFLSRVLSGTFASFGARWRDAASHDRDQSRRDLVFLSDGLSFAKLGGRWVERLCDPLIQKALDRGLRTALWTPLHTYHHPRFTPSHFVQPGIDRANVLGALRALILSRGSHLPERKHLSLWMAANGFGTTELQARRIMSDASRLRAVANAYRRRLKRLQPRLAFIVSYYSMEGMAFILACRELGIKVVDIQHGVQGEMHPAYAAWQQPANGLHPLLPDRFWVWSSWEAQVISRWSAPTRHSPILGGNPWLSVWRAGSSWSGVVDAYNRANRLRFASPPWKRVVLVTLQYGLAARDQIDRLTELISAAHERFTFWIRLHPAMLEQREKVRSQLSTAGPVELDEATDLPLQPLLAATDLHLTHSSSTVIEAAQFGVQSVIMTTYGAELFAPLIAAGWAHVEPGSTSAIEAILTRLTSRAIGRAPPDPPIDFALSELLADRGEVK
jgi:hypothetical protein